MMKFNHKRGGFWGNFGDFWRPAAYSVVHQSSVTGQSPDGVMAPRSSQKTITPFPTDSQQVAIAVMVVRRNGGKISTSIR
jgi:hypothetical protein